jgi:hypothetical protein
MKNNWVVLSLAAVFLAASFGFAGSKAEMPVNIPFAFYAGDQLMNAGKYIVEVSSGNVSTASVITIKTSGGKTVCVLNARSESVAASSGNMLQFNHYGDKHFLSGISIRKLNSVIPMSAAEKEIKSRAEKG